jgi:hypothetical protein
MSVHGIETRFAQEWGVQAGKDAEGHLEAILENRELRVRYGFKYPKYPEDEVVQLYMHDVVASVARPVKELKGFRRISFQPHETKEVTFEVAVQQLGLYDADMQYTVEPGEFESMVGSSSEDIRLSGRLEIL